MIYAVLLSVALLATQVHPPYEEGDCFRMTAVDDRLSYQNGIYLAEIIISIPDGCYPPSNGDPGCSTASSTLAVFTGNLLYVTCTTPEPLSPQVSGDVELVVVPCPGDENIFTDDFEEGNTNAWSVVHPDPMRIFGDGFESGTLAAWSGSSSSVATARYEL